MTRYQDILHLPHHISSTRAQMSNADRAAQFSSFDALSGYKEEIREAGRLTDLPVELTESALEELNAALQEALACITQAPEVCLTCFVPDTHKCGGSWCTRTGILQKLDLYDRMLTLQDGTRIPLGQIYAIRILDKKEKM